MLTMVRGADKAAGSKVGSASTRPGAKASGGMKKKILKPRKDDAEGGSARGKRKRASGSSRIYEKLRDEILSLTLRPGAPLDEVSLGRRFKLSRSPVREALIRLASEKLVVILPNRSTVVAPFDLEAAPRHMDALELMQRTTHRLAAMLRTEQDLARIEAAQQRFQAANEQRDVTAMIESNRDYHVAIAEAGGNPYFTSLYTRLLDEGRRMLHLHFAIETERDALDNKSVVAEHAAITRAIKQRDADLTEQLALEHATLFRERFLRYLDQNYVRAIRLHDPAISGVNTKIDSRPSAA
jgi:DNA-binding GntR family transcriptional regulator